MNRSFEFTCVAVNERVIYQINLGIFDNPFTGSIRGSVFVAAIIDVVTKATVKYASHPMPGIEILNCVFFLITSEIVMKKHIMKNNLPIGMENVIVKTAHKNAAHAASFLYNSKMRVILPVLPISHRKNIYTQKKVCYYMGY